MTAADCTHSFPDPYPQPVEQIGNCRNCGISYQAARGEQPFSTDTDGDQP